MKLLVAVIILVIIGGGVWITQKSDEVAILDNNVEDDTAVNIVETEIQSGVTSIINENSESQTAAKEEADVEAAVIETTQATDEEPVIETPFSTIEDSATVAETQTMEPNALVSESASSMSENISTDQGALDNADSNQFVVPQSYPVTDAAKYFIPKEERGPGRLGGPPPLDFPGGPSDPSQGASGTFNPPPAPGN